MWYNSFGKGVRMKKQLSCINCEMGFKVHEYDNWPYYCPRCNIKLEEKEMKPNCPKCKSNFWTVKSPNPFYAWYCNQCYGAWNVQPKNNAEEVEATKKMLVDIIDKSKEAILISTKEAREAEAILNKAEEKHLNNHKRKREMERIQENFFQMLSEYDKMDEKFVNLQLEIEKIYNEEIKK